MSPLERLLQRIGDANDFSRPRALVTLEEFFEGNDDPGSIGYNLPDPPEPREFYKLLAAIRDRADVADVRVQIMDHENADGWPSSDTLWIITSAAPEEVRNWFPERLAPDELLDGFDACAVDIELVAVPDEMRAVGAWYD